MEGCPFCARITTDEVAWAGEAAVAFADAFPVAPGHTLVCPRRHVEDLFTLDDDEYAAVWALVRTVQRGLAERTDAAGWNVGANVGTAAGQTVPHAHVHVIPRRRGDVEDPRGGIRWVRPDQADYWTAR